jgi:hypothetical protein
LIYGLVGCASLEGQRNITREELIGRWVEAVVNNDDGWVTHSGYLADGRKCTLGLSLNKCGMASPSYYESTWSLDENRISATVKKTSSKYVYANEVIVDEILLVRRDRLVLQMVKPIKSSRKNEFVKVSDSAGGKTCRLVEENA